MVNGAVSAESSGGGGHCSQEHLQLQRLEADPGAAWHMCGCSQVGMPCDLRKDWSHLPGNRGTGHSAFILHEASALVILELPHPSSELGRTRLLSTPGVDEGGGLVNYLELPKVSS